MVQFKLKRFVYKVNRFFILYLQDNICHLNLILLVYVCMYAVETMIPMASACQLAVTGGGCPDPENVEKYAFLVTGVSGI